MRDQAAPIDPGGARWVSQVSATGDVALRAVAFVDGGVIAAGEFSGTLAVGEMRARGVSGRDGFVVRFDQRGKPQWIRVLGGPGDDRVTSLAVASDQSIAVGGETDEPFTAGKSKLSPSGRPDGFVGKLAQTGEPRWAKVIGATRYAGVAAVAIDGGDVVATGQFAGSLAVGDSSVYSAGNQDLFIARYDGAGKLRWLRRAGGPGADFGTALAASDSAVAFAGSFMDGAAFGATVFETVGDEPDAVVGRIDRDGRFAWVTQLGGAGSDSAAALAFDGDQLVAAGRFARDLSGAATPLSSAGSTDGFIAAFSPEGKPTRAASIGGESADWIAAIAGGDGVVIGGGFADRAGGDLQSSGGVDGIVSKLAGTQARWRRGIGGKSDDSVTSVAIGGRGQVAIAGDFAGQFAIDGTKLDAGDELAGFVAVLEP